MRKGFDFGARESWLLVLFALVLRLGLVDRQGLWVDEVFSLAIATGHSLEHPASTAAPELGDFVTSRDPVPAVELRAFLRHDDPPASVGRVVRAVRRSDTSPPLYYVLLSYWTRLAGTSDRSIKLFSVIASVACIPLLWRLGRAIGGRSAAWIAAVLFTVAPAGLYYSTEARMYALLWLVILAHVTLTLEVVRGGRLIAWAASGAIGLFTHYFFAFVWAAAAAWALFASEHRRRFAIAGAMIATGILVAPWYAAAPAIVSDWRITGGWLDAMPPLAELGLAPLRLAWSWLSGAGSWGRSPVGEFGVVLVVTIALFAAARAVLASGPRAPETLIAASALACALGPMAFDLALETHASAVRRYALGGFPAAMLLIALGLSRLDGRWRVGLLAILVAGWLPTASSVFLNESRKGQPYAKLAREIATSARPDDVVLIHAVPSGVLGIARYLPAETRIAFWIPRLQDQSTANVARWSENAGRVIVVESHTLGESSPAVDWIRRHARTIRDVQVESCRLVEFRPLQVAATASPMNPHE